MESYFFIELEGAEKFIMDCPLSARMTMWYYPYILSPEHLENFKLLLFELKKAIPLNNNHISHIQQDLF